MPLIDFSDEDVLRSKLMTPAWYRVNITSVDPPQQSAKGDSTNYVMHGKVLFNADSGDKEFSGCLTPYWNFNSKAKGFMVGFFNAFGVDVKGGTRMELNDTVGKELDVFISNELYDGRMVNKIKHEYRAPKV